MGNRAKLSDRDDWFNVWEEDRRAMLQVMYTNLASDIDAGYSLTGNAVIKQRNLIAETEKAIADAYEAFKSLTEKEVNRWCFYELKRKGAIE